MADVSTLEEFNLGTSDLIGTYVTFVQLPNGELFALNSIGEDTTAYSQSTIEFLEPGSDSITNVTASMSSGALPSDIGTVTYVNELYVGANTLPDLVLSDGGPKGESDPANWHGGQVRVLAPNDTGQYVDVTSELPQQLAFNHRLSTGEIDGQAAIAVDMIGNGIGDQQGIELLIANTDGTFTNWSSHLPANIASVPIALHAAYTASAIADFTGHGGDIFLGVDPGFTNNVLLVNNGSGNFTATTINVPKPTFAGGATSGVVYVLPTQFYGDTHEDVVVVYTNSQYNTNSIGNNYYLQFLKGDGKGGFTDVTSQHFANQPQLTDGFGNDAWVESIQTVNINGFNDLILYQANGSPEIILNNGQDIYSVSPLQVPNANSSNGNFPENLTSSTWGTDAGVQGFYGYTDANQWVFVPITTAYLDPFSATLNQPLANRLYLYGNGRGEATANTLANSFDTSISISASAPYPGVTLAVDVNVNGVDLGTQAIEAVPGDPGTRTLTFVVPGLVTINSLNIIGSADGVYVSDVQVNGVDLGQPNQPIGPHAWSISANPWNSALNPSLGSASDPIQVTGTGSNDVAYVLGSANEYTVTGIGTSTVHLSESAGLDQNSVLTNVAFIDFQNGTVLNTLTGSTTTSSTVDAANQLEVAFTNILQAPPTATLATASTITLPGGGSVTNPIYTDAQALPGLAAQVDLGQITLAQALNAIEHYGDASTSVATIAYEFFTQATPGVAGYGYLVNGGSNPNDLDSPYYAQFNQQNRYINFAANLGKYGAGATWFSANYGSLDLADAMTQAYTAVFGFKPAAGLIASILASSAGSVGTVADYFALYGTDGPNGIGTKAAAVGWLMTVAVQADLGTYAAANDAFLNALANGTGQFNINLLGAYPAETAAQAAATEAFLTGTAGQSLSNLTHQLQAADTGANVAANLDALQTLQAANQLASISLTDSTTPTLSISAVQATNDAAALGKIASPYALSVTGTSAQFNGASIGHMTTAGSQLDLTDLNLAALNAAFSENASATQGTLTVSDGTHSATVTLIGQLAAANYSGSAASAGFTFHHDAGAGTIVGWV